MLQINYSNRRILESASAQSGTMTITSEVTMDASNIVNLNGSVSDSSNNRSVYFSYDANSGSEPQMSLNGSTSLIEDAGTLLNEFITSVTAHYTEE